MNRVGLCVVWRNQNCGSMLQSFATLRKLRSLGCECEVIDYSPVKNAAFYLKSLHRLRCPDLVYSRVRSLKRKIGKLLRPDWSKNDALRAAKFRQFVRERFGEFSEPIHDYDALKAYASRFTDVLVGSDQLWLPSGLETGFYNLAFVPDGVNRIAYAASFGVPEIPAFQTEKTKAYLERIPYLSVREESGQRIVRSLTGRDVPVLPDPAMALSRAEWDEAIPDEAVCGDGYVFAYLLGNAKNSKNF